MNIFNDANIAANYNAYYESDLGKKVDEIEKDLMLDHLKQIPVKHMLEVGCGTGHWTRFFAEQGFQILATDSSKSMLRVAEEKKPANTTFHRADADNLPFENKSFDVISAVTVLEFVDDKQQVFDEMYRVLKPGGWLLLGGLNTNSELGKTKNNDEVYKHGDFLTKEQLENFLTKFGTAKITQGVYFSPSFEILDGSSEQNNVEPAFFAASVQKSVK